MPVPNLKALATALLIACLPGLALAQPSPDDTLEIRLALGTSDVNFNPTTASIFMLADKLGFYEKHGVKVTIIALDGTPQAVAALNAGDVDVADIAIDAAIRLRADNDLPIRGITAVAQGNPFLIATRAEITTIAAVADRSYAIADNGSLDHNLTRVVLDSYGVSPDEVRFVAIGAPDIRIQALAAGQVDATTVSFGTYQSVAEVEGIHVLVDPDEFAKRSPGQSKFVAALESTIEAKREALQRFTNALADASRVMHAEPQQWIAAMTDAREDLSPQSVAATAELNAIRWCVNGCMNIDTISKAIDFAYDNPDFADVSALSVDELIDPSFNQSMLETLGVYQGEIIDVR